MKHLWKCLLPIGILLLLAPFSAKIDLAIARLTYRSDNSFQSHPILDFVFNYGVLPAYLFGYGSLFLLIASCFFDGLIPYRAAFLSLFLLLSVGCGLVTNVLLKDQWGRPRPRHVIEFGGREPFRPFYKPNFDETVEPCKSFPCGHCTMGFYFFGLILIGKRQSKQGLVTLANYTAWILGIALGVTRTLQGGHFVSDVIAGACVMWIMAHAIDRCVYDWIFSKELTHEGAH